MTGQVYGETTPSVTGVEVIGAVQEDYAINVFLNERNEALWFAPDLVEVIGAVQEDYAINVFLNERNEALWFAPDLIEFVDHAPGTEIRVDGVPKKWTRNARGEWIEEAVTPPGSAKK
jgi:hypothetical protein